MAIEHNGSQYRTLQTKWVVSRWYIPGGCDYTNAQVVNIFFDSEEDATAYAKLYEMPPEMATLISITAYDNFTVQHSKSYRGYKDRFYRDFKETDHAE